MSCDFPHGKYFWKSTKYIELLGLFMKGQWINNCKHIPKEICMNSEYIERLDLSTWSAFVFNWVILWKAFGANSLLVWVSFRHGKPCSFMFFFWMFCPANASFIFGWLESRRTIVTHSRIVMSLLSNHISSWRDQNSSVTRDNPRTSAIECGGVPFSLSEGGQGC